MSRKMSNSFFRYFFCHGRGLYLFTLSSEGEPARRGRAPFFAGSLAFLMIGALAILPGNNARAGATNLAPQDEKPPAGNVQNGKKLFTSYGCFECHGHQAEGTSVGGPRLGPNPILFSAFVRYIRQPTGQMPPFTIKVASDADLADIYAFLQSLPQPPKADSIPALK
jgi:mono/diheme cytochrome c family protein